MTAKRLTRSEQQAKTRSALLDAAERVFVDRGFQGASVDAITEAAGFSRGAFYSNFESKEQLFSELLQVRAYDRYRAMAKASVDAATRPSLRATGDQLAEMQADPQGQWMFRLWLELLAHAGRDEHFRELAAGFWSGTRALSTTAIQAAHDEAGTTPAIPARDLATAMIAVDVGLALQHFVDPDGAPLHLYPTLFEALFRAFTP